MSMLQQQLDRIREGFAKQASAETSRVMHRATEQLRESGIMDRIPQVGSTLPRFALPDTDGTIVQSTQLLAQRPLVVTFYRGKW